MVFGTFIKSFVKEEVCGAAAYLFFQGFECEVV